ncbi:MAG: GlsB/YeaQ/YmgE family stress response membrane protein [Gammaproteobacteria bacterium]
MAVTIEELVVWIVVGMLAGTLAGLIVKRKKAGYGHLSNLGLGLVGALIGGYLFDLLRIAPGLDDISISLRDIVSALAGALLFLVLLHYGRIWYKKR